MVIGRKFWEIGVGDYSPSANPPIRFSGSTVANSNLITGVSDAAIQSMRAVGAENLTITGSSVSPTNKILEIGEDYIELESACTADTNKAPFEYYDNRFPAAGKDQPISAVLCLENSALSFVDSSGKTVEFKEGVLVVGAVYYFQINKVTKATAGDYLGYASF